MTGVIIRREERAQMNTEGRWPHDSRGRDWNWSCKARNAKDCLKPPEVRRECMEPIYLLSLQEETNPDTLISGLLNGEKTTFLFFKPLNLGGFVCIPRKLIHRPSSFFGLIYCSLSHLLRWILRSLSYRFYSFKICT